MITVFKAMWILYYFFFLYLLAFPCYVGGTGLPFDSFLADNVGGGCDSGGTQIRIVNATNNDTDLLDIYEVNPVNDDDGEFLLSMIFRLSLYAPSLLSCDSSHCSSGYFCVFASMTERMVV
jgi:hypothetical protein